MPISVPLQAIPSQSLSINLAGNVFGITIRECRGIMAVTIENNGLTIIENLIAAAAARIIPAKYQEIGNFMFLTADQQLPYYTKFNISQTLYYFTAAELAAYRVVEPPPVDKNFFNPVGALPLRFSPQGYS